MTTPEAADYLDRARRNLDEARAIAAIDLPDVAGRTAYLAAYHAAQALIFDRTGKVTKSHRGARSEFARLAKDDPRIDRAFTIYAHDRKQQCLLLEPGPREEVRFGNRLFRPAA